MRRVLWIIGFSVTFLMFGLFAVLSLQALMNHRFLSLGAWTMFITFSSSAYFMFGRLRGYTMRGSDEGFGRRDREPP